VRSATRVPTDEPLTQEHSSMRSGLHKMRLSACGPLHQKVPRRRHSCSRGVCLIPRLNGHGYTASSHVGIACVTSSKR